MKPRSGEEENASCSDWADYITSNLKSVELLPFHLMEQELNVSVIRLDINYIKMGVHCHTHDLHSGDQNLLPAENQLVRFDRM